MHELDALLKPLILKSAIVVILGVAGLLAIPAGILLSRRVLRNRSPRTRIVGGVLLTGLLFLTTVAAVTVAGAFVLVVTVIEPGEKRDCATGLQNLARVGSTWAASHDGRLPADFTFLSDSRDYYDARICGRAKGDTDRTAAQKNYELVSPGARADDPAVIFLRCRAHEHAVRLNGSIVASPAKP